MIYLLENHRLTLGQPHLNKVNLLALQIHGPTIGLRYLGHNMSKNMC